MQLDLRYFTKIPSLSKFTVMPEEAQYNYCAVKQLRQLVETLHLTLLNTHLKGESLDVE